jgi:hypothetical protein
LWNLLVVGKWTECHRSHKDDATSKLDAICKLYGEERFLAEAVRPQQVDEICWRKVKIDVL